MYPVFGLGISSVNCRYVFDIWRRGAQAVAGRGCEALNLQK